eukprot:PhF_6_TR644/c0_g1_i2/m.898/K03691/POFUT; peptide-O-fucosyltransferase
MRKEVVGVAVAVCVLVSLYLLVQTLYPGTPDDGTTPFITVSPSTTALNTHDPATSNPQVTFPPLPHPTKSVELFGTLPPGASHERYLAELPMTYGYNPRNGKCPNNVQPNRTAIGPAGCPVPGLNNILYTQHNKWYCAYRDNRMIHLRDRICSKGTREYFRFSTILQVDYNASKRPKATLCWSDVKHGHDISPSQCTWDDIPRFYATPLWWEARRLIDFHPSFYNYAETFIEKQMKGEKFLGLHLRRGDYQHHCTVMRRKHEPPWISFRNMRKANEITPLQQYVTSCFPPISLIQSTIQKLCAKYQLKYVFVSSNSKEFIHVNFTRGLPEGIQVVMFSPPKSMRAVDTIIVDMALLSLAHVTVFNRFSSFSSTAYEMMYIHDRYSPDRMYLW